jgi:hypothetical protein
MHPIGFSVGFFMFLLVAYLFQLRETLKVEDGFFIINLKRVQSKVEIAKITSIHHSLERLNIKTNDAEIMVNISQFSKKKINKLLEYREIANLTIHKDSQGRATTAKS